MVYGNDYVAGDVVVVMMMMMLIVLMVSMMMMMMIMMMIHYDYNYYDAKKSEIRVLLHQLLFFMPVKKEKKLYEN